MQFGRLRIVFVGLFSAAWAIAQGQQGAATPTEDRGIIRAETRVVLVDAVVTDKKGNYIHDLTAKDFRVWEDNKEQTIKSFSFEADPAAPLNSEKRYLVLFFDNSTIGLADQARARQAAAQFIDANAGPNRLIALANFGGSLAITQNFTDDVDRLKKMVAGLNFSTVSPNPVATSGGFGGVSLSRAEADFGVRDVILALRSLAKSLAAVPGRKILVFMTGGFPLTSEFMSEMTATIDACNRANVAVYPIDIRGLVAMGMNLLDASPFLLAAFDRWAAVNPNYPLLQLAYFDPQHGGGGGGGTGGGGGAGGGHSGSGGGAGGGHSGSGTGAGSGSGGGKGSGSGSGGGGKGSGSSGGGGSSNTNQQLMNSPYSPYNQMRHILPPLLDNVATNQQIMYMLASGTGGFVIANTNDLLGGMQKIGKEQNEYYFLGYTPSESQEGSCHTLKVKVEHGYSVRARTGYCNLRAPDLLAGNSTEKDLENHAAASAPGSITATMQVPFFYTSPNTARVAVALEIPAEKIDFAKEKGKFRSTVNIVGIAYQPDGGVAARFSDAVKLVFDDKKEWEEFQRKPYHYENQFDVASGQYNLKVVFSSGGEAFGKIEKPLNIDPYDGKQFSLSAPAFSKDVRSVSEVDLSRDAALLADRTPMISQGLQLTPSGSTRFAKTDMAAIYVEIYDPHLREATPPMVGLQLKVLDRKSGESKLDTGNMGMAKFIQAGNPVIPVALKLPVETLAAGSYKAELRAVDAAGHATAVRTADFEVE